MVRDWISRRFERPELSDARTGGRRAGPGSVAAYAAPGDLQSTLTEAASEAGGHKRVVSLERGEVYDPDGPVRVPSGTELAFNSAHVDLTSDVDLFEIEPFAIVRDPKVVLPDGYSSTVYSWDSSYGDFGYRYNQGIRGGTTVGRSRGGDLFEWRTENRNSQRADDAVTGVTIQSHVARGIDRVLSVDMDENTFISSNQIDDACFFSDYNYAADFTQRNGALPGHLHQNVVKGVWQTSWNAERGFWFDSGMFNLIDVTHWDTSSYSGPAIASTENAGGWNNYRDRALPVQTTLKSSFDGPIHVQVYGPNWMRRGNDGERIERYAIGTDTFRERWLQANAEYVDPYRIFRNDRIEQHVRLDMDGAGVALPVQDLTSNSGTEDGELRIHEGFRDGGLYRWDETNDEWVKVEDNTTTL